jgi:hypothetical protein
MWIIEFLKTWAELITKLWGNYPFVGAVVTAAAVGGYFIIRKSSKRPPAADVGLLLLAWGIIVPVLGASLDVIAAIMNAAWAVLGFLAARYDQQPLFVGSVIAVGIVAFLVSDRWAKHRGRPARILVIAAAAVLLVAVAVPILNRLWPNTPASNDQQEPTKASVIGK